GRDRYRAATDSVGGRQDTGEQRLSDDGEARDQGCGAEAERRPRSSRRDDAVRKLVRLFAAPFPQADEHLSAARDARVAGRDAQSQAHIARLLADHGLLADDQVAAGVELEERVRARIPQQTLDHEARDRRTAAVPDRDAVRMDAPAE